jgi:two-component system chemotaxis response regulator CheY
MSKSSIRVLIVDDMPAMRTILRDMIEQLGFTDLSEAEDGDLAWQQVQDRDAQSQFGLIISDWNMPGMSGMDLLRAVRSYAPTRELPFLMITGEGDQDHLAEAFSPGITDYVVKPFDVEQLRMKLEGLNGLDLKV